MPPVTQDRTTAGVMSREEAMRRAAELLVEVRTPRGGDPDAEAYGLPLRIVTGPLPSY